MPGASIGYVNATSDGVVSSRPAQKRQIHPVRTIEKKQKENIVRLSYEQIRGFQSIEPVSRTCNEKRSEQNEN